MYNYKELLLEIITMPFTDIEIYENVEVLLFETEKNRVGGVEEFVNLLAKRQSVYSLDEVYMTLDKFYKPVNTINENNRDSVNEHLLYHLRKIADTLLTYRDGDVCIKYWKSENNFEDNFFGPYHGINKISLWNSLNRMMTTDTLVCAYLADKSSLRKEEPGIVERTWKNEMELISRNSEIDLLRGFYHQVKLEDIQLSEVLNRGIAETHLHASAGGNIYNQWTNLMNAKSYYSYPKKHLFEEMKNLQKQSIVKLNDRYSLKKREYNLTKLVLEASIIRLLIIYWFRCGVFGSFNELITQLDNKIEKELEHQLENDIIRKIIIKQEVKSYSEDEMYTIYEYLYDELEGSIITDSPYSKEYTEDYLVMNYLNDSSSGDADTTGENVFLFRTFSEIFNNKNALKEKTNILTIFFRYISIKNMFFKVHVQQNSIKGLSYFQKYFKTSTKTAIDTKRKSIEEKKRKWKVILKNQIQDRNLKKLELRISMYGGKTPIKKIQGKFVENIIPMLEAYKEILGDEKITDVCLLGVIIHFIKGNDKEEKKCWIKYGEYNEVNDREFIASDQFLFQQKNRRVYAKQIVALRALLFKYKNLSKFVVGIDAASNENDAEPWVFAPIYKYARDVKTYLNYGEKTVSNHLGFTFHVGEDFRHILTGLRRIDEVIEHFKYHAGDRIGHGIALGVDIDKWIRIHPVVVMPRIEYLENLLWIWGICKDKKQLSGIDGFLERKIMELANEIYSTMEGITVFELWKSYCKKFDDIQISNEWLLTKDRNICDEINNDGKNSGYANRLFCCETDERNAYVWNSEKLYLTYHCNNYKVKMDQPISIDTSEINNEIIKDIQSLIAAKVSKKGIVVETNPTSNRAIGEVDDIFDHYILTLKDICRVDKGQAKANSDIMVTINTDDPSVFHTGLSNEFAYIYYALVNQGYSKHDILQWIDEVRENGMSSSFIKTRTKDDVIKEIEELLKELKGDINV